MKRIEAIEVIAREALLKDALLVCNIGFPSRELFFVCDRPENFYMLGSMGLASSIGLGLALSSPKRRVIAIDGDGSILMNLGTLATFAAQSPSNYLLVILDNCSYGSTGCQPTCTAGRANLAEMAKAAGVHEVAEAHDQASLRDGLSICGVLVVKVEPGNADVPIIKLPPKVIIDRFMSKIY